MNKIIYNGQIIADFDKLNKKTVYYLATNNSLRGPGNFTIHSLYSDIYETLSSILNLFRDDDSLPLLDISFNFGSDRKRLLFFCFAKYMNEDTKKFDIKYQSIYSKPSIDRDNPNSDAELHVLNISGTFTDTEMNIADIYGGYEKK